MQERVAALLRNQDGVRGPEGAVVDDILAALDVGALRACEPAGDGWVTNGWVKQGILFAFARYDVQTVGVETLGGTSRERMRLTFNDRLAVKQNYEALGARCVPPGVARYGSFIGRGAILMPGFINVGAYVGDGSMVDTWATVGSCAQIGKHVHLSGGVGIGGVLEPPQAQPVIVEDGAFIGSRCVIVEGVFVGREAVLGAGLVLTASTPIVDVRGREPVVTRGRIEARSVVIPGTLPKRFPAGEYGVPCALVIGERSESTDRKTSLEQAIRKYGVVA